MEVLDQFDEGGSAKVAKVMYESELVALKTGKRGWTQNRAFEYEADMMAKVDGAGGAPRILALAVDRPAMIMSYLPYPSLDHAMKRGQITSHHQILQIFKNAASSLKAVHEAGVVHCDIKADNILVDPTSNETYVIDFGFAAVIGDVCPFFPKRTIEDHAKFPFYDPVMYTGGEATPSTDVYSLGFMISELYQVLIEDEVITDPLPEVLKLSEQMTDFEPEKRPSMEAVIHILQGFINTLPNQ